MRARRIIALVRDIAYVSLGRYGQYLVTIVVLPVLARLLGVAEFGRYGLIVASAMFGSAIVDLGLTQWMATRRKDEFAERPNRLAFTTLRVGVLGAIAVIALVLQLPSSQLINLSGIGLIVGGLSSIGDEWILIAGGRFSHLAICQAAGRLIYVASIFLLLPHHPSAAFAAALLAGNNLLISLLTIAFTARAVSWDRPRWQMFKTLLRPAASLTPAKFAAVGYGQGPVLVFSAVTSPFGFGLYSAADKLTRASQAVLDAFGVAMIPRLLAGASSDDATISRVKRGALGAVVVGVAAGVVLAVAAPLAVSVLYGSDFNRATLLIQIQALAFPAASFTSYMLGSALLALNRSSAVLWLSTVGIAALIPVYFVVDRHEQLWLLPTGIVFIEWSVAVCIAVYARRTLNRTSSRVPEDRNTR